MPLSQLQPRLLWQYFHQLTQIPRPTYHETAVQQFVLDEAARLGLAAERDEAGNIVVRKPASAGMEKRSGVILQSHLDMVPQKNQDSAHNFETDPIQTYIANGWVRARGTTLGADNGIGAAAALAVLADTSLQHGPIEALFTASEESGMDGAKGLRANWLQGSILLNLDSEDLGEICIGCAGGADASFSLPIETETAPQGAAYQVSVRGLKGGHSGIDIIKQRGNAIKILAGLLSRLNTHSAVADINGGTLRNAIPREAQALFVSEASIEALQQAVTGYTEAVRRTLPEEDRAFTISLETAEMPERCWTRSTQNRLLAALNACPNGADSMSVDIPGLVETSTNLAKVSCESGRLNIDCLLRSQNDFARDDLAQRMADLFTLAGGESRISGEYPGWRPVPDTPITRVLAAEGEKLLGRTPKISVIHAGLECGILGTNYPHWQMASFGPTIEMPHSPDERVHIESVEIFWQWLVNVLAVVE